LAYCKPLIHVISSFECILYVSNKRIIFFKGFKRDINLNFECFPSYPCQGYQTDKMSCEQPTCSICLEAATEDICQLHCKHYFHTACYNNWARSCIGEFTCPNCRSPSAYEDGWRHSPDSRSATNPGDIMVSVFILTIAIMIGSILSSVTSTCMCRLNWEQGQTYKIENFWWSQSVHTRPDLCVYVC